MKRIKILARRNLNMSPGKLAAQAVHAALGLCRRTDFVMPEAHMLAEQLSVVVLHASDKKFYEALSHLLGRGEPFYLVKDAGVTEVEPGTTTTMAFLEDDPNG